MSTLVVGVKVVHALVIVLVGSSILASGRILEPLFASIYSAEIKGIG
jgi:hypothetical protein